LKNNASGISSFIQRKDWEVNSEFSGEKLGYLYPYPNLTLKPTTEPEINN
jgi:hypothetical protein